MLPSHVRGNSDLGSYSKSPAVTWVARVLDSLAAGSTGTELHTSQALVSLALPCSVTAVAALHQTQGHGNTTAQEPEKKNENSQRERTMSRWQVIGSKSTLTVPFGEPS